MARYRRAQRWIAAMLQSHDDQCVYWPFAQNTRGYGKITVAGKSWGAHRFICQSVHGPAPFEGALTLHSCGNGHHGCVNPKHLRWGTATENVADAMRAGTLGGGEVNANSKLTDAIVRRMRQLAKEGKTHTSIAAEYGVNNKTVGLAVRGETWAHIRG